VDIVKQMFAFERVAVVVLPWHEPMEPPERGTRVEVRLLADEPPRGSRFASQRIVADQPVFRADLFDQTNAPPGNLNSAHFHPYFDGIEPCDRVWDEKIKADPTGWLAGELGDLSHLLERAGVDLADASWVGDDAAALRDAVPAIVAAVEQTWETVRTE
jgi:hypothetical protein